MAKLVTLVVVLLLGVAACSTICKYDPASIPLPGCPTPVPTPSLKIGTDVMTEQHT